MSGGGPAQYPGGGPPTGNPLVGFGQPVNEAGANPESVVSSYQYSYPGISYGQQSGTTYNIPGGGPDLTASMSDGSMGYPDSRQAQVPRPMGGSSSVPYPLPGGSSTPYPPMHNLSLGSSSYEGGNPSQYGAPQAGLQGSHSYPMPKAAPYPPQRMSPYPVPPNVPESASPYPVPAYTSSQVASSAPYPDQGWAPPAVPQESTQSIHQAGSPAYPIVGMAPPTYPSIGGQPPEAFQQNSIPSPDVYKTAPPFEAYGSDAPEPLKKALVIGCNYHRTSAELKGCINDAKCMQYLLSSKFGFEERNIRLMTDDQAGRLRPTKQNILEGMRWLVDGAKPGTSLFFHFSGHGSQKRDFSGDEKDGFNETILPTDHKSAGQIVDDDINRYLVNVLTPGVMLHAVIDACHSGTAMDLQYYTKCRGGNWAWKDNGPTQKFKGTRGGIAFQFGACKDSEVAQDTNDLSGSVHTGAATFCFIDAIENGGVNQSYAGVLSHMHRSLLSLNSGGPSFSGGVSGAVLGMLMNGAARVMGIGKQTPQLSCSEKFDVTKPLRI